MASLATTSAGTTIGISAALPGSYDQSGFEALTFTIIGEIVSIGEYARKYEIVKHNPIDTRETIKLKGSFDEGTQAIGLAKAGSDAGQTLCRTALASDNSYAFEVVLQDGTTQYYQGQVTSFTTNPGSVNSILSSSVSIEINTEILEISA